MDKSVHDWLQGFADCVRRRDFAGGRRYFREEVYCFGSYAGACTTLDELVANQWQKIWPNITHFRFRLDRVQAHVSADGKLACIMALWHSVGYTAGRKPYQRDGRMTAVLTRSSRRQAWQAFHTHYSLIPGTPQTALSRAHR